MRLIFRSSLQELRDALQEMTTDTAVSRHAALLSELTRRHPNTIQVLPSVYPENRYTCVMHAFEFAEDPRYVCIAKLGVSQVYAGQEFMHWLIATGRLREAAKSEATEGNLVVYFDGEVFKHIGKCSAVGQVYSKWGQGLLYQHAVDEVPSTYGESVRYYEGMSTEVAMELFVQFAKENGVPEELVEHLP